jgi:hypothetical protein
MICDEVEYVASPSRVWGIHRAPKVDQKNVESISGAAALVSPTAAHPGPPFEVRNAHPVTYMLISPWYFHRVLLQHFTDPCSRAYTAAWVGDAVEAPFPAGVDSRQVGYCMGCRLSPLLALSDCQSRGWTRKYGSTLTGKGAVLLPRCACQAKEKGEILNALYMAGNIISRKGTVTIQ